MTTLTATQATLTPISTIDRCPYCGEEIQWLVNALQSGTDCPEFPAAMESMRDCEIHNQIVTEILLANETLFISLLQRTNRSDSRPPRGYCPYNLDGCSKTCNNWRRNRCRQSSMSFRSCSRFASPRTSNPRASAVSSQLPRRFAINSR